MHEFPLTPPTLIQCHRFPLILSLFCICDPLLLQREPGLPWPLATPPHGYTVHLLTVTGVAKSYALKPYTGSLPPSHKAAALLGPTEGLLIELGRRAEGVLPSLRVREAPSCHRNCFPVGLPLFLTQCATSSVSFASIVTSDT